jgi:DNA-directed RNA polymerase specialized sigma subunit
VGSGFLIHRLGGEMELSDLFDCESLESVERKIDFERMVEGLKARDKRIVALYASGCTQEEIGLAVGVNQSQISRILAKMHKRGEIRRVNYREENI